MWPVAEMVDDHRADERPELAAASVAATVAHELGQHVRPDDAGVHGVLEVVADVGDAIGPRHDLALGRHRCRA